MLRLRLPERCPSVLQAGAPCELRINATNESGSAVPLADRLGLLVQLVDAVTLQAVPKEVCSAITAPTSVDLNGSGVVSVSVQLPAPRRGDPQKFRLRISAKGCARCLPLRRDQKDAAPTVIPVCSMYTSSFVVERGAATGSGKVPASDLAGSAARKPAAADGEDFAAHTCEVISVPLSDPSAPSPSSSASELRFLEQNMRIGPGFGSIVWDCALTAGLVLHTMAAAAGGAAAPGRGGAAKAGAARKRAGAPAEAPSLAAAACAALATFRWAGKRVLDLGTGTGLLGIAVAALGARVVLTDLPSLLPLAAQNAALNSAAVRAGGGDVTVAPLVWGEDGFCEGEVPPGGCADVSCAAGVQESRGDSATAAAATAAASIPAATLGRKAAHQPVLSAAGRLLPPYDVVCASEVAYRTEVFPLLLNTLCKLTGAAVEATGTAAVDSALTAGDDALGQPFVLLGARKRACCEMEDFISLLGTAFHVLQLTPAAPGELAPGAGSDPAGAGGPAGGKVDTTAGKVGSSTKLSRGGGKAAAAGAGGGKVEAGSGDSAARSITFSAAVEAGLPVLPPAASAMISRAASLSKTLYDPMLFLLLPRKYVV